MINQDDLGKRISFFRKKNNLTQEQLGERLCISGKTISKWERGIALPDIVMVIKLSEILNVSISEILTGRKEITEKVKKNEQKYYLIIVLLLIILSLVIYKLYIK